MVFASKRCINKETFNINFLDNSQNSKIIAPNRSRIVSYDVNQQANSLVSWEQYYDQHSNGSFNGYLDELKLGGIHLFEEFTNQSLTQQCYLNENSLWLGFSLQSNPLKINNQAVSEAQIMVRPSEVNFELITPKNFHIFGLVLDKDYMCDHLFGDDAEQWFNESSTIMMEKNVHVSYELTKLIQLLLNINSPSSNTLTSSTNYQSLKIERLKPLVTSKIADLLVQAKPSQKNEFLNHATKWRVIDKIHRYIAETGHQPLTISELCKIAFVSRRTLQYCFEHEFGCSPIQYLRDCRLNEIRRILLDLKELQGDIVISDVALQYGFYHTSTFNEHYKRLFGETPRQTINRSSIYKHLLTSKYR